MQSFLTALKVVVQSSETPSPISAVQQQIHSLTVQQCSVVAFAVKTCLSTVLLTCKKLLRKRVQSKYNKDWHI